MRKLFLTFLFVLAAALLLILFVEKGDGYVLIALAGQTIEMPVLLALLILLLVYFLISISLFFLRTFFGAPGSVSRWIGNQRQKQSLSRTSQGLVAFVEGRWDYASKSLERSAAGSSTPFVNYLFAARASSELGDVKAVDGYLKLAEQAGPEAHIAIGLTQAELQCQNGQYEKALATLLRVRRASQSHPVGGKLLTEVYVQLGDWHNLLKLLPTLGGDIFSQDQLAGLENQACEALIQKVEREGDLGQLQAEWKRIPASAKKRESVIAIYVRALLRNGHASEAELVVRQQLQRHFSSEMAELYGMTIDEKPGRQYSFAQKLLKSYETDSALLLTMGRLSLRLDDTESARSFFEKSLAQKHSAAAFAELASLYSLAGEFQKSSLLYAKAAMLRGSSLSAPLFVKGPAGLSASSRPDSQDHAD